MNRLVLAAALSILFILPAPAMAFKGMSPMGGVKGPGFGMNTRPPMDGSCPTPAYYIEHRYDLGLSEAQTADLRKLDFQLKRQMILKGAAVKALELELTELVTDPGFDTDAALGKLSEIEKARTGLRTEVIKSSAKARDLLDSGQKDKLRALINDEPPSGPMTRGGRQGRRPDTGMKGLKDKMMREMMEKNMPR